MNIKNIAGFSSQQTPEEATSSPNPQNPAEGIQINQDSIEQQSSSKFLNAINQHDFVNDQDAIDLNSAAMKNPEVGIDTSNYAPPSAWDKFYALVDEISALIEKLPPELQEKAKSDLSQLVSGLVNSIWDATRADPGNQAIEMQDKWNHSMNPGLDALGNQQGPHLNIIISDDVWKQLQQFEEQIKTELGS